ncbi:hypothetical protein KBI23_27340 [bacterium]|nr:hypothetical protein [bacterium]MBP9806863.1 hypothetical protein [bacterium]
MAILNKATAQRTPIRLQNSGLERVRHQDPPVKVLRLKTKDKEEATARQKRLESASKQSPAMNSSKLSPVVDGFSNLLVGLTEPKVKA